MAHVRKQIRDRVATLLVGSSLVGSRVYRSSVKPLGRNEQASMFVYTTSEQSEDVDNEITQQRRIRMRINTVAKGEDNAIQDLLDQHAVFIETAFANDPDLGGKAASVEYKSTEFATNTDGEKTLTVMTMIYEIVVITINSDPETSI